MVATGAIASAFTIILTWVFVRHDRTSFRSVGAAVTPRSPVRFLSGFAIGLGIVGIQMLFLCGTGYVHWVPGSERFAGRVALAFSGYVLLALREELTFRGYPFFRLYAAWGALPAFACMCVVFAAEHFAAGWSVPRAIATLGGALLFGMAALATRGLAIPVGVHAAFNFGQWMVGLKEIPGVFRCVVDEKAQILVERIGYTGYFTGMLLATFCFGYAWKTRTGSRSEDA